MTDPTVRADSVSEQFAWLGWKFGDRNDWSVEAVTYSERDGAELETMTVWADGERHDVSFDVTALRDSDVESDDLTLALDRIMRVATAFAEQNPPHHPGSIARFPVPWDAYSGALAVPMAVLAVDDGRRGLFSPPRIVAVEFATLEPFGVGEFPGFNPENWPPERLGDWPPPGLGSRSMSALQGMIARFSACWMRLLAAWFARATYPYKDVDARDALELLGGLDLPQMRPFYRRLNPAFWAWLDAASM